MDALIRGPVSLRTLAPSLTTTPVWPRGGSAQALRAYNRVWVSVRRRGDETESAAPVDTHGRRPDARRLRELDGHVVLEPGDDQGANQPHHGGNDHVLVRHHIPAPRGGRHRQQQRGGGW